MTTGTCETDRRGDSPCEILALLREEAALYEKLHANAARQRSLVVGDDMEPLLASLADRQRLSVELTRIGTKLAPTRRDWPVHRARFTPSQLEEADRLLLTIKRSLRQVIESDEEDARLLNARKQAIAGKLRATHATGVALTAYRASGARTARIDQTHEAAS
jgi:hypothetical protein